MNLDESPVDRTARCGPPAPVTGLMPATALVLATALQLVAAAVAWQLPGRLDGALIFHVSSAAVGALAVARGRGGVDAAPLSALMIGLVPIGGLALVIVMMTASRPPLSPTEFLDEKPPLDPVRRRPELSTDAFPALLTLRPIREDLESEELHFRLEAINLLGQMNSLLARRYLTAALGHPCSETKLDAANALSGMNERSLFAVQAAELATQGTVKECCAAVQRLSVAPLRESPLEGRAGQVLAALRDRLARSELPDDEVTQALELIEQTLAKGETPEVNLRLPELPSSAQVSAAPSVEVRAGPVCAEFPEGGAEDAPLVALVAEGTYPFHGGGLSVCIDRLIHRIPSCRFLIIHLTGSKDLNSLPTKPPVDEDPKDPGRPPHIGRFPAHSNLKWPVKIVQLQRPPSLPQVGRFLPAALVSAMSLRLESRDESLLDDLINWFERPGSPAADTLFVDEGFHDLLRELYARYAPEVSYRRFFWAVRSMLIPLTNILTADLPKADVYHATCTGYAGLVASIAGRRFGAPSIVTEHAIYTRELRFNLAKDREFERDHPEVLLPRLASSPLRSAWIELFNAFGRYSYRQASVITTLYEANRATQVRLGAPPEKTVVIPNGVDLATFRPAPRNPAPPPDEPLRIGLCGRIVAIKDPATFLRAIALVHSEVRTEPSGPRIAAACYGSGTDSEGKPTPFFLEISKLAEELGLKDILICESRELSEMPETYRSLDVLCLTSVSEGQPLVILEAMATGIPVVATDVGSCREILTAGDLPPAGFLTPVMNPTATAEALLTLVRDSGLRRRMGDAGRQRAVALFDTHDIHRRYRDLYRDVLR